jgi:DNA replication protein DnaC
MLNNQTIEQLRLLRLLGLINELTNQQSSKKILSLTFDERLGLLIEAELNDRDQRKQQRLLKNAKLKISSACIEDIDFISNRSLNADYLKSLYNCQWLDNGEFMAFTGFTGVGKTWLACAFGQLAIRKGFPVLFYRFPLLLENLEISRRDGSLPKLRKKLARAKLLIIDDFALANLKSHSRQDFLDLVDERTGTSSFIFTSQLPISKWHEYIGEETYADAIMDRIAHRCHLFELTGDSLRKKNGIKRGGKS